MGNANTTIRVVDHDGALPPPSPSPCQSPLESTKLSPHCSPLGESIKGPATGSTETNETCARVSSSSTDSSNGRLPKPISVQVPNAGIVAGHSVMTGENTSPLYCNSSSTCNNANVVSRYQQISGQMIVAATSKPGAGLGSGRVSLMNCTGTANAPPPSTHSLNSNISPSAKTNIAATDSSLIFTEQHAMVPVYSECMGQSHIYVSEKTTQATGLENMIATLIEWKYGGMNVCVEGSWDDWTSRIPLQKSGKGFTLLKFLPEGVYHYRFVVDGESKHAPDSLFIFDTEGKAMNVLDVQGYVPESLDGLAEFEAPSSPDSSYDNYLPGAEDYSKDPPLLPSQLHLNSELESLQQLPHSPVNASISASPRPDHVILNHLFLETRKQPHSRVLTLGFTHRFRSKYITVILHKPLRR